MAEYPTTPFDPAGDQEWRELEQRLQGLAGQVRFPPTPDLAGATRQLLSERHAQEAPPAPERLAERWPRLAIAAAVLILIAAAVLAVSSPARDAVARWLEIPGVRLLIDDKDPPPPTPAAVRTWLGEPASLDAIVAGAGFSVALPQAERLGKPDETYLFDDGTRVSCIFLADDRLPAIAGSDVGLMLMQFPADPDSVWIEKHLGRETDMEIVRVNGADALWIEGAHELAVNPGSVGSPETRLTANVLIWNRSGITYRLEANLPRNAMIEIAESMQPISP